MAQWCSSANHCAWVTVCLGIIHAFITYNMRTKANTLNVKHINTDFIFVSYADVTVNMLCNDTVDCLTSA